MKRNAAVGYSIFALLLLVVGFFCSPAHAAGVSPWDAVSLSVGVQGRWLDQGGLAADRSIEGAGNAALGLTPHVSLTGGVAYGFGDSYVRGQVDARITATDVNDTDFNVWLGAGRYFSEHPSDGLNEWAGKAGLGWRPLGSKMDPDGTVAPSPFVVGATAAYGLDTERRSVTVALVYAFKITKGVR